MPGAMTVQITIKADGTAAVTGLQKVQGALDTTGKKGKEASSGITALISSLNGLALTAGAALSVGALASSFMAANLEASKLRGQLVTATGSIQAAAAAMEVLQSFAAATPYTLAETTSAFITLKNRGLDSTIAAMTSYGNTSAALGKSIGDMAAAVADAVNGDFARAEEAFSVNAKQTGDQVAMTFRGITTTIGNNAQEIQQYLVGIGQTEFAGSLERQGQTLGGVASTLGDSWAQLMVTIGDTGATSAISIAITGLTGFLDGLIGSIQGTTAESGAFMTALSGLNDVIVSTYADLKSGAWSETTTAIMATAGAIGGAIGLMTSLSAAVGIATGVWGAFTAVLMANPITLAIAGIGALAGVLYALQDQTIQVGNTTTTVGATVSAIWETTASYSEAVWDTFSAYVSEQFNRLPPAVSSAGSAIISVWSAVMTNLQSIASGAVNYVANLFTWLGRSAGVLAGEVAMSFESGFNFDRLKEGLSGAVEYTDRVGAASAAAADEIAAMGMEIEDKAGAIASANLEEQLATAITSEHASQQKKAAQAAKLAAFEQANLARNTGAAAMATDKAGKAHGGAAKAASQQASELDKLIASVLPARDDTEQLAAATAILGEKLAKGELSAGEYAAAMEKVEAALQPATEATQELIDKYDRQGAQARELAEDQARLNAIIAEGGPASDRAKLALENLGKAQAENAGNADTWAELWKNGIKRVDDAFAGLWKDMFSGTKSTLESLKSAITSWLAEVAHALLTKPLVVALTASLSGASGTAGAVGNVANSITGGGGSLGGLGNIASGLSSLMNWGGSVVSSLFSGAVFSGISSGFGMAMSNIGAAGYFGAFTSNMALASSSFSSGAIGMAIGAAAPYLLAALPIAAIAYGIFAKYQKDQEPRYGAYAATTHGGVGQFEDSVGVKGAFGLTFGMNDKGSANIDAEESRAVFEGFAKMSDAMAQFYGADVSAQVEASLKKISEEHYAKTGILNYAMDANQAFDVAFTQIIDAAAATGDSVAVVMKAVVGDLSGTAEAMAGQIGEAMQTTSAVIAVAKSLEGTDTGKVLELGSDLTANALKLVDYANSMKWSGETTAEVLGRMGQYMTALNTALDLSGQTVTATGAAFIDLARNLAYAADEAKIGIKGLLELQAFYYEQFTSPETKFTKGIEAAADAITEALKGLLFPTKDLKLGGAIDPLMIKDREAFTALLNGLDLATESGRKLYVELLKLGPAFDAIFDGAEAFTDWLRPQDQEAKSMERLTGLFKDWGLVLPTTREELEKLVASGGLTTEQMAILGGHLDDLKAIFDALDAAAEAAGTQIADLTDLHIRLATALGDAATATRLQREQELAGASNDSARAMLLMIWAAEDMEQQVGKLAAATLPFRMVPIAPRGTPPAADTELLVALARLMGSGWTSFDPDKNNLITLDELEAALGPLASNEEIGKLLAALDSNGDGTISALEQLPLLIAANIAPLFDKFDKDANGQLSLDELRSALGGVVSEEQLQAIYALLDINGDGLIDKLEAVRLSLYTSLRDIVSGLDQNSDSLLSQEELLKVFGTLSPERQTEVKAWLEKVYGLLDADKNGLLNALEALPLSLAAGLAQNFAQLDTSKDQMLSLDELKAAYGDVASDEQLEQLLKLSDANGDGLVSIQEAANLKLDLLALKADKLSDVVKAIEDQAASFALNLATQTAALETALGTGFGAVVTALSATPAIRQSPELLSAPNLIREEAGDGASLRQALAGLQAELAALRASQQQPRDNGVAELRGAATSFLEAAKTIPERIELVMGSLYSEAGY